MVITPLHNHSHHLGVGRSVLSGGKHQNAQTRGCINSSSMCLLTGYFGKTLIFNSNSNLWIPSSVPDYLDWTTATNTQCDEGTGGVQLATPLTSTALGCGEFMFTWKLQSRTEIKILLHWKDRFKKAHVESFLHRLCRNSQLCHGVSHSKHTLMDFTLSRFVSEYISESEIEYQVFQIISNDHKCTCIYAHVMGTDTY